MTLHVFKCSNRRNRTGLTPDKTGSNLPTTECEGGSWNYWKTIEINLGDPGRIGGGSSQDILAAIQNDGYYINDTTILFSEG